MILGPLSIANIPHKQGLTSLCQWLDTFASISVGAPSLWGHTEECEGTWTTPSKAGVCHPREGIERVHLKTMALSGRGHEVWGEALGCEVFGEVGGSWEV